MAIIRDWKGLPHFVENPPSPVDLADLPESSSEDGPQVTITHDGTSVTTMADGSVIIGAAGEQSEREDTGAFSDNICDKVGSSLTAIATDLLDGIDSDARSRQAMVGSYTKGMDLLGLKIEERTGRRQRKNTSTIRHPVLLEAVVSFQSTARAELLPAAGPCKVEAAGGLTDGTEDALAQQLEDDINFYLTTTATEYYPDTDRGLFYLGYGGTIYKKVYKCPLRNRPVSECVYLTDLIVSENATDLDNALRVTHKIEMTQQQVRRMQIAGVWKDVAISAAPAPLTDEAKQKIGVIQGVNRISSRPKDQPFTIYECYCELIPSEYGFSENDVPEGLALPYRVTIEKESRTVLDMRRAWRDGDELYQKDLPFVKFGLIPGLGFLDLGFLHLLGNQTLALTAIWRILVDAGMFNNFPGGVKVKGTRQTTNEINPGPGEWAEVDTGPVADIRSALMPLPYKEPSAVFIQLAEIIAKSAQDLAGTVSIQVGEGRGDIPVGTMLAMVEQQTKNMAAVHKRLHTSQKRELMKLKELFADDPEPLYRTNPKARQWQAAELRDTNLVPASDPNVPSQIHRIMLATAKVQLASQNPDIYNKLEAHTAAWKTMGVDPTSFLHAAPPQQQDPKAMAVMANLNAKQQDNQIKERQLALDAQRQQREASDRIVEAQTKDKEIAADMANDSADRQSREKLALIREETERLKLQSHTGGNI